MTTPEPRLQKTMATYQPSGRSNVAHHVCSSQDRAERGSCAQIPPCLGRDLELPP